MTLSDGLWDFQCGVLIGAKVAKNVAMKEVCELTLTSSFGQPADEQTWHILKTFLVQHVEDVADAEACGALKNVVDCSAGFVDSSGLGNNTKLALILF